MIFSYTVLADYIGNNKLNLNDFKPHLLIMTTKQKQRLVRIVVQINTPTKKISPIKSEMLLGIFIQDDLKWNEYIQNNEKSLLNQLNTRLNALKMISNLAIFKTRLMIWPMAYTVANISFKLVFGVEQMNIS